MIQLVDSQQVKNIDIVQQSAISQNIKFIVEKIEFSENDI